MLKHLIAFSEKVGDYHVSTEGELQHNKPFNKESRTLNNQHTRSRRPLSWGIMMTV